MRSRMSQKTAATATPSAAELDKPDSSGKVLATEGYALAFAHPSALAEGEKSGAGWSVASALPQLLA